MTLLETLALGSQHPRRRHAPTPLAPLKKRIIFTTIGIQGLELLFFARCCSKILPYSMPQPLAKPPIPSPSSGTTFKVAMGILVVFLLLQLIAAIWHFLPQLQRNLVERALAANPAPPAPIAVPATPAPAAPIPSPLTKAPAPPQQPAIDNEVQQRIITLVQESDKSFRVGEYDEALSKITDADQLVPKDPGILLRIGRIYEKMGKSADAAAIYNRVLNLPNLPQQLRAQTERRLTMLSAPTPASTPTLVANEQGSDVRDEFGLQPGATLGIVDTRFTDEANGSKNLLIAIKSRPDIKIDPRQMTVHVFFYERDQAGNKSLTESKVLTEWLSPPVNWSEQEPELLRATYNPPLPSDTNATNLAYEGYVVGIYYNNEIQDTRANPGSLADDNPLPLYLKSQTK